MKNRMDNWKVVEVVDKQNGTCWSQVYDDLMAKHVVQNILKAAPEGRLVIRVHPVQDASRK